jgi:hypothetical protein
VNTSENDNVGVPFFSFRDGRKKCSRVDLIYVII